MKREIALLLTLALASAQQGTPPPKPPQAPATGEVKFSVTSRLVIVNVIAKDKDGKPIENLRPADFTVLEDEKPQKVSVFEYQRLEESLAPQMPAALPPDRPKTEAPKPQAPKQIAPPANPGQVRFKDRRLLVMFFDFASMPPEDQIRAQEAALKFIDTQMSPADVVAVMAYSTKLKVVQEFTGDRELLTQVIKGFHIGEASEFAADNSITDDTEETDAFAADESEFNIFNTDQKLAALESAAKMLAAMPEKKALIYFSSGISRTGTENQSQLRATVNAAVRSNMSFYPVDARGLIASAPAGNASQSSGGSGGGRGGSGVFSGASQRQQGQRIQDQQETLYTLAADTGGKSLLDSNDLSMGLVQAQKDISSYYILGFYSTNEKEDGKYRRVKVRLDRYPQAKLDFRTGYFAPKQWREFNNSDKERQLEEALLLGDPMTDLPMAVEMNWFRLTPDRYFIPMAVKVPGAALELARKKGSEETELEFIAQVRDDKGKLQGTVRDGIKVKLQGEQAGKLSQRSLQYDSGFALTPGTYTIKMLARENQSGKMGTFESKFVVPDVMNEKGYLRMSSVVWSNQREALQAAVGAADRNNRIAMQHPLVADGKKLIPSITRVFRKDQSLYVYFEIYDPPTTGPEGGTDIQATVSFYRGKLKAFETEPVVVKQSNFRRQAARVQVQVPLAALDEGHYLCQVNVVDHAGKKFGFARASMVLLAPEKLAAAAN